MKTKLKKGKGRIYLILLIFIIVLSVYTMQWILGKSYFGPGSLYYKYLYMKLPIMQSFAITECVNEGGEWEKTSCCIPNYKYDYMKCNFYFTDGGNKCSNSSECEGCCVIDSNYATLDKAFCQKDKESSCVNDVENFKARGNRLYDCQVDSENCIMP